MPRHNTGQFARALLTSSVGPLAVPSGTLANVPSAAEDCSWDPALLFFFFLAHSSPERVDARSGAHVRTIAGIRHRGSVGNSVACSRAGSSPSNLYSARTIAEISNARRGAMRRCTAERHRRWRGVADFARSRARPPDDVHRFTHAAAGTRPNGRASWTSLTDNQASLSIASLALDPREKVKPSSPALKLRSNGAWSNFNIGGATGRRARAPACSIRTTAAIRRLQSAAAASLARA